MERLAPMVATILVLTMGSVAHADDDPAPPAANPSPSVPASPEAPVDSPAPETPANPAPEVETPPSPEPSVPSLETTAPPPEHPAPDASPAVDPPSGAEPAQRSAADSCTITAASAGTKPAGQTSYLWGWARNCPSVSSLTAQRLVDGQWVGFGSTTPDSTGYFTIVAPNATSVGLHTYRIGFEGVWSDPVTLNRIPGVTAAGAGTKPVGEVTYVWGTAHGAPNRPVFTEVLVAGRWSRSQVGTTDSRGSYTLKLTYGATQAGTYTYRVGVDSAAGRYYSPTFTLRRTAAWSATIRNTVASDVRHTYRAGCPVGPGQLSTITMTYRNYSGTVRTGVLVVRRDIAGITRDAFKEAFDGGFRIGQMTNPDHWQADDVAMMAANNTSAFNCRHVVGNPYRMSPHSTGRAVDINPAQNPYRAPDGRWYPTATYATSRPTSVTGLLHTNSPMVKAMTRRGFQWFSGWDWHHFER